MSGHCQTGRDSRYTAQSHHITGAISVLYIISYVDEVRCLNQTPYRNTFISKDLRSQAADLVLGQVVK